MSNEVPASEWLENFRMSKDSFYELVQRFRPFLEKKKSKLRQPISVPAQVGIFFITLVTREGIKR